jgi:microcystin-dependent protein
VFPDDPNAEALSSFQIPFALPTTDPTAGPFCYVCFNLDWQPYVVGCLMQLLQQTTWDTTDPNALDLVQMRAFDLIQLFTGGCVATGQISMFGALVAPDGWLLCDGSAVSRTTYADLFAVIGTTFGIGDGVTTFNLPDLGGLVPVGSTGSGGSYPLAATGGEATHTLTTAEMPAHTHTDTGHLHSEVPALPNATTIGPGAPQPTAIPGVGSTGIGNASLTNTGGGGAHNNIQPYIALTYIIKT